MRSANSASRWIICALSMVVVTLLALGCSGNPTATPTSGDSFDKPLDTPGAAVTLSPEERQSGEVPTASVIPVPTATAALAPPSSTPPTTGPLIPGIVRVSVSSAGAQANGRSQLPSVSGDGRYITFASYADNLVDSDTNRSADVFVHDLVTRQTIRVSVSSEGTQGNGASWHPHISADGRYVTFASTANNLVSDDVNEVRDIFVHDISTGETTRVSVSTAGGAGNGDSYTPFISGNGRYVTFISTASNLVPDDTNACGISGEYTDGHCPDVFVHDREIGTTERLSLDGDGNQVDGESGYDSRPSISDDGRYVAFNQFDPVTYTGGRADRVYLRDRQEGITTLVSVDNTGRPLDGNAFEPTISADGRRITFVSQGAPTVDGVKAECQSVSHSCVYAYVRDVATGETLLASVDSGGQRILDDFSYDLSLSVDGSNVTFSLIRSDGEAAGIYLHNLSTLDTVRITDVRSWQPSLSSGGEYVAFATDESFVADDTNAVGDIYIIPSVPGYTALPVVPEAHTPEPAPGEPSIAYIGADNNVWVINTDGTDARQLTMDADPAGTISANVYSGPAWSPDGRTLYVTYGTQNTGAIYRIDLQSGQLAPIGPQDRLVRAVAASPDGEHLGYIYDVPAVCPFDYGPCLALLDLKSSISETLACMDCGAYTQLEFSPAADNIALVAVGFEWSALGLYRLGTSDVTFPDVGGECRDPEYSPETGRLWAVCTSQPFWEERTWSLYTLDTQTGERTEILRWDPSIRPSDIDLSPDSTQLTFELDGTIDILDLATMESRTLIEGRHPAWRPSTTPMGQTPTLPGASAGTPETLKVAILVPLLGAPAQFGQLVRDGALMAVDEWNAIGGINGTTIEVVIEDSRCMVDVATAATNKVIDEDGVRFIIGEVCSTATASIAEIAAARNVLHISPGATEPSVTLAADGTTRPTVFSAGAASSLQGTVAARFAVGRLRAWTAAVFADQSYEYTRIMAEAFIAGFEAAGGRVVVEETYARNTQDFSAMLTKVEDADPDVLYLPGYTSAINLITAQAKAQNIETVLLGGSGWNSADLDVSVVEGGYFTVSFSPKDPRPGVQTFVSRYQAKYGTEPNTLAMLGYDAAQILFQSMALAGTTTDVTKIAQAMASGTFTVVIGDATYDARHNPVEPVVLLGIQDSQIVYVDTVAP